MFSLKHNTTTQVQEKTNPNDRPAPRLWAIMEQVVRKIQRSNQAPWPFFQHKNDHLQKIDQPKKQTNGDYCSEVKKLSDLVFFSNIPKPENTGHGMWKILALDCAIFGHFLPQIRQYIDS